MITLRQENAKLLLDRHTFSFSISKSYCSSIEITRCSVQNEPGLDLAYVSLFSPEEQCAFFGPDSRLGDWRIDERVEELLAPGVNALDPRNFVEERLFAFLLHHEVHKATRLQYPLSILCLSPDLHPSEATPALTTQLAREAIRHIRTTDVGSILPPSCVALLLVDAETRNLAGILERLREAVEPLWFRTRGKERFTLSAGGGGYPRTATNANTLLLQAMELMSRAKAEGGNRLHLAQPS